MNSWLRKIIVWPMCLIFLIGMIFAGDSNVLCIGDNGHIKFETFCLPCCDEADVPGEIQNEPGDCSDCSHVELSGPLWSKRIQNIDPYHLTNQVSVFATNAHFDPISIENTDSRINKFYLVYGQSPPSYSIATTVLRC